MLLFAVEYVANELAPKWGWLWSSASVLSLDSLLSDSVMEEIKPRWGKQTPSLIFSCIVCELKLTGRKKDSLPAAHSAGSILLFDASCGDAWCPSSSSSLLYQHGWITGEATYWCTSIRSFIKKSFIQPIIQILLWMQFKLASLFAHCSEVSPEFYFKKSPFLSYLVPLANIEYYTIALLLRAIVFIKWRALHIHVLPANGHLNY